MHRFEDLGIHKMQSKPVIIVGAGGHAKVVADVLKLSGRDILGFTTPDLKVGTSFLGKKILGDDSIINKYLPNDIDLVNGIGALPKNNLRWKLSSILRTKGYKFVTVIHPNALIASDVSLDEGVQIMAGVIIQSGTEIGKDCIINTGVLLDHDCRVEANCHLAPGVICSGNVSIGEGTHLGTGVSVIQNISIGSNSVIAAGSTIYKDVSNDVTFMQTHQPKIIVDRE